MSKYRLAPSWKELRDLESWGPGAVAFPSGNEDAQGFVYPNDESV